MVAEALSEFAPAKINLTLHVTGRRADGFHLLDSLVVFADLGDRISLRPDADLSLAITGPQAASLPVADDNLVLRAARFMGGGVALRLDKVLPVSSGIGGGSADAAAVLRAMARMGRGLPLDNGLSLGADVPVCLQGRPVRMTGVGEGLRPVAMPDGWLVLINPGVAVSTPAVFRALPSRDNPAMPAALPDWPDAAALAQFLRDQRNDMQAAAETLAPAIADVVQALAGQPGCLVARMSGSGATCFGLFADEAGAKGSATALQGQYPGWWVRAAAMLR